MTHLERLGNAVEISLNPDEQGYLGRECPNPECEGYFKIVLGTGIQEGTDCYCPYCGYHGIHNEFVTGQDTLHHTLLLPIISQSLFSENTPIQPLDLYIMRDK